MPYRGCPGTAWRAPSVRPAPTSSEASEVNARKTRAAALATALITGIVGGSVAACGGSPNAQQYAQQQQQQDAQRLEHNQPIPQYNYSQERQTLIEAQNMAAKGTPSVTFFFNYG